VGCIMTFKALSVSFAAVVVSASFINLCLTGFGLPFSFPTILACSGLVFFLFMLAAVTADLVRIALVKAAEEVIK